MWNRIYPSSVTKASLMTEAAMVHRTGLLTDLYSFDDDIPVCIYGGLKINFTDLLG